MPETGMALKNYILPVVVLLEVIFFVIAGVFAVISFIALARSKSRKRKNKVEVLSWGLKSIRYSKRWVLSYVISCVFGSVSGFTIGDKMMFYMYFFVAVIFSAFFLAVRQAYNFVSKELETIKAILDR